jgi:hypothetical protein
VGEEAYRNSVTVRQTGANRQAPLSPVIKTRVPTLRPLYYRSAGVDPKPPHVEVLKENPARLCGRAIDRPVPTDYLRRADHYDDADCTDGELCDQAVVPLRQGELAYYRKQNAETENL